ncbi:MAG: hypothetical protein VKI42_03070 [Synechococcaceae cyanobacterium]|nr:hypothetical protein [Synechococcaceae cyanobacterium]
MAGFLFVGALVSCNQGQDLVVTSKVGEKLVAKRSAVYIEDMDLEFKEKITKENNIEYNRDLAKCIEMGYSSCPYEYGPTDFIKKYGSNEAAAATLSAIQSLKGSRSRAKVIGYKLVAIDVDGTRRALEEDGVTCFDPSLKPEELRLWKLAAGGAKTVEPDGSMEQEMMKKLCERYARY